MKQLGVQTIVCSPGSRNLPIIRSAKRLGFRIFMVIDERVAGFIALGLSKSSGIPSVVVTTSGSAALNLSPALVEAYYSRIPVIALTADRPSNIIDKGENQTMVQTNIYMNYVVHEETIEEELPFQEVERKIKVLHKFLMDESLMGPVHINLPISEPLLTTIDLIGDYYFDLPPIKSSKTSYSIFAKNEFEGKKVLIYLSGIELPESMLEMINKGIAENSWVVFYENPMSILDLKANQWLDNIRDEEWQRIQCDILITVGGHMISKRFRTLVKGSKKIWHIDVAPYQRSWNVLGHRSKFIQSNYEVFFTKLIEYTFSNSYVKECKEVIEIVEGRRVNILDEKSFNEFSMVSTILGKLEESSVVYWGNSSLVRYGSWSNTRKGIFHYTNRGVSGIDGVLSSAVGARYNKDTKCFYVLLGDISLLYESNALQSISEINPIKIIVFNNAGGKIFDNIHDLGDDQEVITPHSYEFDLLAKMYRLDYYISRDMTSFESNWIKMNRSHNSCIFELKFNSDSHRQWHQFLGK